jgi:hypothetical protein
MTTSPPEAPVIQFFTLETISTIVTILIPVFGAIFALGVLYEKLKHQREELTRLRDVELIGIKNKLVELETKLGTYLNSLQELKEMWKEERDKRK